MSFAQLLLPFFIFFSYVIVPAFAQEEVKNSAVEATPPYSRSQRPSPLGDELCALSKDSLVEHPEFADLRQGDVFAKGTVFDVTNTAMRLVPQNHNCSAESKSGKNTCMVCRSDVINDDMQMRTVAQPLKTSDKPTTHLLACPDTNPHCASWETDFLFGNGLKFTCLEMPAETGGVRPPMARPLKESLILALGIKVQVPCRALRAVPGRPHKPD